MTNNLYSEGTNICIEAEQCLLSQAMMDTKVAVETTIYPEMMIDKRNARILKTIKDLIINGVEPDLYTICHKDQNIEKGYIAEISGKVASSANWKHYEGVIKENYSIRKLELMAKEILGTKTTSDKKLELIEETISSLMKTDGKARIQKIGEAMMNVINKLEEKYKGNAGVTGLSTGIEQLDEVINGYQNGLLYVIGARPSQGKSALALQMADHITTKQKKPAGLISGETSILEIGNRLLASHGSISAKRIQTGFLMKKELEKILETSGELYEAPLYIWDQPTPTLDDVKSRARYMARINKINALFVDYAQIIKVPGTRDRRESVEQVSMSMKELARELNIPVILLAQLQRPKEARKPVMSDFQWSSQLEQDADVAMLLYHEYAIGENMQKKIISSEIICDKVRDGEVASVPVRFEREFIRFAAMERTVAKD